MNDLKINDSYVNKLRHLYNNDKHFLREQDRKFLQNVQDASYNFTREKGTEDELEARTVPFKPKKETLQMKVAEIFNTLAPRYDWESEKL